MAKVTFDDGDGVWRTIGGKHIFIRDGESLSSAMKRSGKFKSAKKKDKEEMTAQEASENQLKRMQGEYKDVADLRDEYEDKILSKEDKKENNEQSPKKAGEVKDMIKVKDGTYLPIREGEKEEDVMKAYNERQEKYRRNLEPEVSKNLRDPRRLWDQDLVDTYIEMNERGDFKDLPSEQRDKFTRNMKNMEGEPLYSPDRQKSSNEYMNQKIRGERDKSKSNAENTKLYNEWLKKQGVDKSITESDYKRMTNDLDKINKAGEARERRFATDKQTHDIERASGMKVKNAFETDLYGNGKQDRFELDDGRWVAHTKESLGQKDDTWTVNKLENGKVQSQKYDSYDDMIKNLGGSNKNETITRNGKEYNVVEHKEGNSYEGIGANRRKFVAESPERYRIENSEDKSDWGWIEKREYEELKSKSSNNSAYKKAFQEYKKAHPNSKLNLQDFIKMSEGK